MGVARPLTEGWGHPLSDLDRYVTLNQSGTPPRLLWEMFGQVLGDGGGLGIGQRNHRTDQRTPTRQGRIQTSERSG